MNIVKLAGITAAVALLCAASPPSRTDPALDRVLATFDQDEHPDLRGVVVLRDGRVVEQGPTSRVLTDPEDPYTRRLLAAVPVADPAAQAVRRERRRSLEVDA